MNTITKTIVITDELIENLLCTAFEGGSTYWAENISCEDIEDMKKVGGYKSEYLTKTKKDNAVMYVHVEDDKHPITKKSIIDALQKMDNPKYKYTKALSRIINEEYDAYDADVVLQTACFGQVIYG
tara:strand:- start:288 stop:665 length:378 start_codon:yes stop_codon:yes gene_type:complete